MIEEGTRAVLDLSLAVARNLGGGGGDDNTQPVTPEDSEYLRNAKIVMICCVGFGTLAMSWLPWWFRACFKRGFLDVVNILSAAAAGVILGALLSHTIPEGAETFKEYLAAEYEADSKIIDYPFGTLIVGAVFTLLVAVDYLVIRKGIRGGDGHGHSHGGGHSHDHVSESLQAMAAMNDATTKAKADPLPEPTVCVACEPSEASSDSSSVAVSPAPAPDSAPAEAAAVAGGAATDGNDCSVIVVPSTTEAQSDQSITGASTTSTDSPSGMATETDKLVISVTQTNMESRAWLYVIALSLHAFFDGLAVGAETQVTSFYSILIAVAVHKAFDGLAVGAAVFPAGFSKLKSFTLLAVAAFMTPLGIIIGMAATDAVDGNRTKLAEAIIISMTGGSFLFISIAELLPASLSDGRKTAWKILAFTLGWAAMVILAGFV